MWGANLSFGGNGVGVELLCGLGEFNEGEANGLVGQCVNELGRVLCHVELLGSVAGMRAKHSERSSTRRGGSVIGLACDYDGEVTRRGSGEFRGLRLTARGPSHRRGCSSAWRRRVAVAPVNGRVGGEFRGDDRLGRSGQRDAGRQTRRSGFNATATTHLRGGNGAAVHGGDGDVRRNFGAICRAKTERRTRVFSVAVKFGRFQSSVFTQK